MEGCTKACGSPERRKDQFFQKSPEKRLVLLFLCFFTQTKIQNDLYLSGKSKDLIKSSAGKNHAHSLGSATNELCDPGLVASPF